jgi:hypothetical protein
MDMVTTRLRVESHGALDTGLALTGKATNGQHASREQQAEKGATFARSGHREPWSMAGPANLA